MKRKSGTADDELWSRVARSVKPLATGHPLLVAAREQAKARPSKPPPIPAPAPKRKVMQQPAPTVGPSKTNETNRLAPDVARRITKGRTAIEGRLDLHGMTREAAYPRLLDFLSMSRAVGRRTVLVITGKGFSGEGVLRREVPQWLATPPFRALVSGAQEASSRHGGEGALYIRLKRP